MEAELFARFIDKILVGDGCWEWTAKKTRQGYARMKSVGKMEYAHRLSYEHFVGEIPDGTELDHLCRVRHCVKPAHLEAVPHRINTLRGNSPSAIIYRDNVCKRGHSLVGAKLRNGRRVCTPCENVTSREREPKRPDRKEYFKLLDAKRKAARAAARNALNNQANGVNIAEEVE